MDGAAGPFCSTPVDNPNAIHARSRSEDDCIHTVRAAFGGRMILYEDEQRRLSEISTRLWRDAMATAIFLIDANGQLVAGVGRHEHIDTTSLASLVAGSVAATSGLAQLFGEDDFPTHYHEGHREHLYLAKIAEELILAVIFDERSSLGLVRLRVKKAARELEDVYNEIVQRSQSAGGGGFDPFADITEDDIDSFFGDSF